MLRDMFSFQNLNTSQLAREFTSVTGAAGRVDIVATGGRDNGPCLRIACSVNGAFYSYVQKTYDAQQTWIVGLRMQTTALPSTTIQFLRFADGATVHVQIGIGADGTLKAYRSSTLLGSSTNAISINTLYYIEVKAKIDDSAGTVDIVVNGVNWLSLSSQDTRNAGNASANNILLGLVSDQSSGHYVYYCDLYVADIQTGQVTDFIGPQRCDTRFFSADGNYTDWTPSTGATRHEVVDENPANDDTDYATGTAGNKMTLKTTSLGYTPAAIFGVKLTGVMKKTASGTINVKRLARKSSTDYSSGNLTPPDTSYTHVSEVLETDPATSAAFTKTDLESNIEWGFEVV